LASYIRVLEVIRGVDSDLDATTEPWGTSNVLNDDKLGGGRFCWLGDVVTVAADENINLSVCWDGNWHIRGCSAER